MNFSPFSFLQQLGITIDNLVLYYDANNTSSYPGSGTDWFNLQSTTLTSVLTNGPTFTTGNGGMIVLDGTNDYTTGPDNSILDFGTNPFTIECWVVINANSSANNDGNLSAGLVNALNKSGTLNGWNLTIRGNNVNTGQALIFERQINSTGTFPRYTLPAPGGVQTYLNKNQLYQLGISHSSTNGTRFFIDGVYYAADLNLTNVVDGTNALEIGRLGITGYQQYINGAVAILRIYNNKELTPQELLQNYNANKNRGIVVNGLSSYYDAGCTASYAGSGTSWTSTILPTNTTTLTNGPTFSTNNGGSIVFDGTNDFCTRAAATEFEFGSGDFTIEVWVRITGNSSTNNDGERFATLFSAFPTSGAGLASSYNLSIRGNSTTTGIGLSFGCRNAASNNQFSSMDFTFSTGILYQVGITRFGGNSYFFINGQLYNGSVNITNNLTISTRPVNIGALNYAGYNQFLNGRIAIVRTYKGKGLTGDEILQNYNANKNRI